MLIASADFASGDVISSSVTCAVIAAGFDLGHGSHSLPIATEYPAGYPIRPGAIIKRIVLMSKD